MEKFQLTLLFKIIGLGSASGLVYTDDRLFIISDNSTFLYEFHIPTEKLNKIPLLENPRENIAKKEKPDFESISFKGDDLYILGSGSTEKRNLKLKYNTKSGVVSQKDFGPGYEKMKSQLRLTDDQLNIEGMAFGEDRVYFFQRGNGADSKNGIIHSKTTAQLPDFEFTPFALPKFRNVESSFTDGILVGDKIYFLATAEDTQSTYLDGEVLGSLIGRIDLATMKVEFTKQISGKHKFEGLTLYRKTEAEIEFLLCEDNDTDALESVIYSLKLPLK